MVRCKDNSLYTGFTTDLLHRLQIHNQGKGAKYTRARRPVHLVWYQEFLTEHDARSLEAQIKNWKKKEKEKFVKLKNMKLKKERVLAKVLIMKIGFLRKVCLNKMERHRM